MLPLLPAAAAGCIQLSTAAAAAVAATSVTQRCCCSLSQGSASSVLWPSECKNFHATDIEIHYACLQPIVAHSHTHSRSIAHTPAVRWWRHRHACVSFSVKLPVVFFFCLCIALSLFLSLPLWQQQQQQKAKQNKAQSKNKVGKLHGPLHATPAAAMRLSHRVFYNHSARPPPALL